MTQTIHLTRPDDWHLHLRDGAALQTVVPHSAAQFGRAIVMPNLQPPITTAAAALAYRARIKAAVPTGMTFEPLMTLYLTDNLPADEIKRAVDAGVVAVKLYLASATTHSDAGVTDLRKTWKTLEVMQRAGMPLLLHGEVTAPEVDIFDREAVFIDTQLIPLRHDFPELKIVFEHITTREAVQYVNAAGRFTAATITAHHLLFTRNAIFTGAGGAGLRPHYFCLPVLKREAHRLALLQAATSGSSKFFLGTDSAPHAAHLKESAVGCAGCYTAPVAMELYAQAFDSVGALDQLEAFASFNGADFYGLPRNTGHIILKREPWVVPESFAYGQTQLKPLRSGETLPWRLIQDPLRRD
jgi:dihydroorotase